MLVLIPPKESHENHHAVHSISKAKSNADFQVLKLASKQSTALPARKTLLENRLHVNQVIKKILCA